MNIVVLAGGLSTERDVSFQSGKRIAQALREKGHKALLVDSYLGIEKDEKDWQEIFEQDEKYSLSVGEIPKAEPDLEAVKASRREKSASFFGPNVIEACRQADIVFLALHGADGENGKLQAAFDLLGIRYTGNSSMSCALAMDKGIAKHFFHHYGIPTPAGFSIKKSAYVRESAIEHTHFPCVVKPSSGGSSIGVSIVKDIADFDTALKEAFRFEEEILVEDFIKGREFSVGVLDGVALPVIEIAPKSGFYDYKNKYEAGAADEICPADIDEDTAYRMQLYAERVMTALGLSVYARMDFILDEKGDIFCLEANTLPGMTPTSLMPQEAEVVGISYGDLCEEIIQLSMERFDA